MNFCFRARWLSVASIAVLVLGFFLPGPAFAKEKSTDAMEIEIPAVAQTMRHIDLLEHPSYLFVALGNNGVNLTNEGKITIQDSHTLQYKTATVRFTGKRGPVYSYHAKIEWGLGMVQTSFDLPIEVDTSLLNAGKILVRVYPPLARLFPQELTDRIRLKSQRLADLALQQKMVEYFDRLDAKKKPGRGIEGVFELVMIDAYNQRNPIGDAMSREPGDAEPLSDQLLLLITLTVWLVIVPGVMLLQYLWRRFGRKPVPA